MSAFKTIGIISRPRRVDVSGIVPPLMQWLAGRGIRAAYDQETATSLREDAGGKTRHDLAAESDLLVVLGGDGTLLAAAREAAPRGIPILPINLGSLGFLTSFTLQEMYPALEETLAGHLAASERAMLRAALIRDGKTLDDQRVLNEVVINKGALARMIEVKLSIDQDFVCRYRADGLIVATPTGSTGYSLSAGGPIVHPIVESIVVTPICPHTLSDRPLVVGDKCCVEMNLVGPADSVYLTLDGQIGLQMQSGDRVRIFRAEERLKLIQPKRKSYYEILRSKLKWGEA
ncbi:MAG TPA: NAD(+)/NADH kinase [Candidatus Sulfotelmatobacter sp.]|jgi:NAD+ kinase|nr:NAD(+)/NADH kinase [Candidatus Sulfotelmatobacter sp.]